MNIALPESLSFCGRSAFYITAYYNDDSNWENGVLYIGNYLIAADPSITECTIKSSCRLIAESAFYNSASLTDIYYSGTFSEFAAIPIGGYNTAFTEAALHCGDTVYNSWGKCGSAVGWTLDEAGTVTIIGAGAMTDYNTHISSPFYSNDNITSIVIEDGITSVGRYAFSDCYNLTSIVLPDSIASIGKYAFNGCGGISSVSIPAGVTAIGAFAFYGCSDLENVYISDLSKWCGITFENESANPLYGAEMLYLNDEPLTDIVFPYGIASIGSYAFCGYEKLSGITIPSSVTSVGSYAFYGCSALTSITIPEGVTVIGNSAFYNCSAIKNVTLPNSLTSIDDYAFYGCSALTDVYYAGSAEEWQAVSVGYYNEPLTNAAMHCNGETPDPLPIEAEITMTETGTGYRFEVKPETAYESCSVYAAIYDESGALIGLGQVPLRTEGSTSVEVSGSENDSSACVFVWSDLLQPITTEKTFIL